MSSRNFQCCLFVLTALTCHLTLSVHGSASQHDGTLKFKSEWKINKVHVIFMNHLDVGYYSGRDEDPGYAVQVISEYLTTYFDRAINMSHLLIDRGYVERFVYTTHPWLLSLFFDCPNITLIGVPLKCPTEAQKERMVQAIKDGHIAWHASPMNLETDNLGARLFDYGLSISQSLDKMFNINRTHATMSQRDVPGITKAVIPILLARGIKAISVGVNPGTAPPAVPTPFLWKFNENDTDGIIGFWDKGGYPINPGPYPAQPKGIAKDKCLILDGMLDEALCFAFRTDNTGPPVIVTEVLNYYEILRKEFPGAELVASTFDNFVKLLEPLKSKFPVRTYEIADTWIQGMGSDPKKTAMYYAFERQWERCMDSGKCSLSDPRIEKMLRFLIKLPEHTWGVHNFLDTVSWTNEDLAKARRYNKVFNQTENSWYEQRQFLDFALAALGDHPLKDAIKAEYTNMEATVPDLTGYEPVPMAQEYKCPNGVILKFGIDGSLSRLYDPFNKVEWASPENLLGQITYDTYIEEDFDHMAKLYNYEAGVGYDKPNVTKNAHPEKKRWQMLMTKLYKKNVPGCDFWAMTSTVDPQTRTKYGAPKVFYNNYVTGHHSKGLKIKTVMIDKVTTRLPESLSVNFTPLNKGNLWTLYKMGQPIDPCHVVLNGTQYVHGVDQKLTLTNKSGNGLEINTLYNPLVFIGTLDHVTSPFPVPLQPIDCSKITSMAFNIYNNIWDTNFIFWYPYDKRDANFKAEFDLNFAH